MSLRIVVAAIGRLRDPSLLALTQRYLGRCPWHVEIIEQTVRGRVDSSYLSAVEAELLLACVPPAARVVTLDERGQALDSEGLASRLGRWRDSGEREIAFLIGGPDGHGPAALARADLVLSLGPMTWPHELVRLMLAEQLYRASAILAGHPYHRR